MMLSGWGRAPRLDCRLIEPGDEDAVVAAVRAAPSIIARGAGRSYGDAALNPDATLSMLRLDGIRSFDPETGVVDAGAGIRLADLVDTVLPDGWFPAVVPGTAEATLGGMVAADVHGKNHHVDGSFGDHVEDLRLVAADGSVVRCAPGDGDDLFDRTLGGMGLTGVVLSARIRLRRVETAHVDVETHRRGDLDGLLSALEGVGASRYTVAWIDTLARGRGFGRGLVFAGDHAVRDALPPELRRKPLDRPRRRRIPVRTDVPVAALGRRCVGLFNAAYHHWPRRPRRIVDVDGFFFPLDAVTGWNRLYGPRGFRQFQCVLPAADGGRGLERILTAAAIAGAGSFLAVLKTLGPGRRPLSFPLHGHTLALDMPAGPESDAAYRRLCDIALEHGGRIYLAKDALADPIHVDAGYPEAAAFRARRRGDGAADRFGSALSRRLAL
jgi:FAD/FMN-containing dehydrogenase